MSPNRRHFLKSIGAASTSMVAAPYLNLAHAQGSPIPIGVALPLTGNAAAYGPDMGEAAKRTAAKINNAGGILGGRKLELFIEDSESSASVAANLTQKFINVHKAQSLVGYWGTPEGMSSRPIAIQNKVVLMVSSAANAITEGDTQGYVWRFQLKATDWGTVISRATLNKLGFKSVGVMGLQNAFVLPIMKVFEDQMKANGRQVVDSLIYNPEQPSYRAEVERIFGKNPMAVDWPKQIIAVGNGPGQEVDDVVEALKLVRAGTAINFQGAGSTCDFTPNGDQLGRGMGQWIIRNGKSQFVEYAKP